VRSRMILSRKLLRILAVRVVRSIILRVANDVPQAIHGLKRPRKYHKIEMFPGSSMVEHSAVNRGLQSQQLVSLASVNSFRFIPKHSIDVPQMSPILIWVLSTRRSRCLPEVRDIAFIGFA